MGVVHCRLVLGGPTTNQALGRQMRKGEEAEGMVYDIKIENFDISYGRKSVLVPQQDCILRLIL